MKDNNSILTILEQATKQDLIYFIRDVLNDVKDTPELYNDFNVKICKNIYGCHFNRELLEQALNELKNVKFTLEESNETFNKLKQELSNYNEFDFNYTLNAINNYYCQQDKDIMYYASLAMAFLKDKKVPYGKALNYYLCIKKW